MKASLKTTIFFLYLFAVRVFQANCYFFVHESNKNEYEVNNTVAIHYLKDLHAMITRLDNQRLLYLEAHGSSEEERPGFPKLVMKAPEESDRDDLLEFDLVIIPDEKHSEGNQKYELKIVLDVLELPFEPKWIKVNAAFNADIALVREYG